LPEEVTDFREHHTDPHGQQGYPIPSNPPLPKTGFKYPVGNYGNYCGAGNEGGHPIDALDNCCAKHDHCYHMFDVTLTLDCEDKSPEQQWCDAKFCKCIAAAVESGAITTRPQKDEAASASTLFHCDKPGCNNPLNAPALIAIDE
jgi:hypothetical protein